MLPDHFGPVADDYEAWFDGAGREAFAAELACLRPLIGPREGMWLEVGVGTGRFAGALGLRYGLDASAPMLAVARRRGLLLCQGLAEALPFDGATFSGVLFTTTLCFLPSPPTALAEARRVIRSNGRVVVGFLPADGPVGQEYARRGRAGHRLYSHARFYTAPEVIAMAAGVGFAVASARSCRLAAATNTGGHTAPAVIVEGADFVALSFAVV